MMWRCSNFTQGTQAVYLREIMFVKGSIHMRLLSVSGVHGITWQSHCVSLNQLWSGWIKILSAHLCVNTCVYKSYGACPFNSTSQLSWPLKTAYQDGGAIIYWSNNYYLTITSPSCPSVTRVSTLSFLVYNIDSSFNTTHPYVGFHQIKSHATFSWSITKPKTLSYDEPPCPWCFLAVFRLMGVGV